MKDAVASSPLQGLLNQAIARELQVSVQYMLQHAVGAGLASAPFGRPRPTEQEKFVASHSSYFLPGATLKKIAIAEMRHAEAISERVILLGGELPTQPDPITIGTTTDEMLESDREQERGAIELYGQIIDVAGKEGDDVTMRLFQRILAEEVKHHGLFSNLLGGD
jgi:bacterioferritin